MSNIPPTIIPPEHMRLREDAPLPPEYWPDVEHLVIEDDTPVDNLFSEKQQRLLTEPLYCSWAAENRKFLTAANVAVFYGLRLPPMTESARSLPVLMSCTTGRMAMNW